MIYLDNAATTRHKPDCVVEAVTRALCSLGNPGRGAHEGTLDADRVVFEARLALAGLFHAEGPDRIAFTANSTEALNIAIKGILQPGDHVITTARTGRAGCGWRTSKPPSGPIQGPSSAPTAPTSPGTWWTSPGWAGRPGVTGCCLWWTPPRRREYFPSTSRRWESTSSASLATKACWAPRAPAACMCGRGWRCGRCSAGAAECRPICAATRPRCPPPWKPGYIQQVGLDAIREQELDLMWNFYRRVSAIPGVTVYGDFSQHLRCPIVALNVRDYDSSQVSDALSAQYGIATRPGAHCAPLMHRALGTVEQGAVRFSFSHFNTREEIETAASALAELAQEE